MRRHLQTLGTVALFLLGSASFANSTRGSASAAASARAKQVLEVRHAHGFSRDEARIRVDQLLDYWAKRFGVQRDWQGDRVHVKGRFWGMDFDGVLFVRDHEVRAVANDPGSMLRGTALGYVSGKLRKYLHPTYEG